MRKELIKKYAIIEEKFSGQKFHIEEMHESEAVAFPYVEDGEVGEVDHSKRIKITAENCVAFRFLSCDAPLELLTGYSIKDGKLMKDGNVVTEQGELTFDTIFFSGKGYLVLNGEKNKTKSIYTYEPIKDRFRVVSNYTDNVSLLANTETTKVLLVSDTEKVKDEDGNEQEKLKESLLLLFDTDGGYEMFVPNATIGKVFTTDTGSVVANYDKVVIDGFLTESEKHRAITIDGTDCFEVEAESEILAVYKKNGYITVHAKEGVSVDNRVMIPSHKIQIGTDYACIDDDYANYYFANKDHSVITIGVERTKDRGSIFTKK